MTNLATIISRILFPHRPRIGMIFVTERNQHSGPVIKRKTDETYKECYRLLEVNEACTLADLKEAFVRLAKLHHPDSTSPSRDAAKFVQIKNAYSLLQEKLTKGEQEVEPVVEKDHGIKHTVPQHRQYLTFEGVGTGTPSQRQQQYYSRRAAQAVESVREKRVWDAAVESEDRLVLLDKQAANKHKIRNAIERLVEDLIQESMAKGEFSNLPGQGKPIDTSQKQNPYIDGTTHRLNQVLINNGFTPTWITLAKEIRQDTANLRQRLQDSRNRLGPAPLSPYEQQAWDDLLEEMDSHAKTLNTKIDHYNLVVPFLYKQLTHFRLNVEARQTIRTNNASPARVEANQASVNYDAADGQQARGLFSTLEMMFRGS